MSQQIIRALWRPAPSRPPLLIKSDGVQQYLLKAAIPGQRTLDVVRAECLALFEEVPLKTSVGHSVILVGRKPVSYLSRSWWSSPLVEGRCGSSAIRMRRGLFRRRLTTRMIDVGRTLDGALLPGLPEKLSRIIDPIEGARDRLNEIGLACTSVDLARQPVVLLHLDASPENVLLRPTSSSLVDLDLALPGPAGLNELDFVLSLAVWWSAGFGSRRDDVFSWFLSPGKVAAHLASCSAVAQRCVDDPQWALRRIHTLAALKVTSAIDVLGSETFCARWSAVWDTSSALSA
jgi:hypothetical protein